MSTSQTNEQALESVLEKRLTGTCLEEFQQQGTGSDVLADRAGLYCGGHGYYPGSAFNFNRGAFGGDEEENPLDLIIKSFNERWFNGWQVTPEEQRIKFVSLTKSMKAHPDFLKLSCTCYRIDAFKKTTFS